MSDTPSPPSLHGGPDRRDRARGALLGLAVGDALGVPLEFSPRGTLPHVDALVGGGPFGLPPGAWTDDTSMALCLGDALVEDGDDWPLGAMRRFVRWYRDGHRSSTGHCFDIGNTTRAALHRFEATGEPLAGSAAPREAGNGSLMRLAPVAIRWADDWERAVEMAAVSSRLTHAAPEAVDACRYLAGLLVGALGGASREMLLGGAPYEAVPGYWARTGLAPAIAAIARGSFHGAPAAAIASSGYVVHTLEAALWAVWHADGFRDGAIAAVNLADDADTTGAVYGQLAGALWGASGIPAAWLDGLAERAAIAALAERLVAGPATAAAPAAAPRASGST